MRYLVTGATGFLGRRLALRLRDAGHEVRAVVRDPAGARDLAAAGVELFSGDITDRSSLQAPMMGTDGVFHLAALYKLGRRNVGSAEHVNVTGTRNVLETMRDLGVEKGVYTSTLAVFSDTHGKLVDETYRYNPEGGFLSEYDRTKHLAHYEVAAPLQRAGLPLVTVMPGVVYGPGDPSAVGDLFRQYLQRRLFVIPAGTAFSWAFVDDVVTGHLLAMERGRAGEDYIIGGPVHTLEGVFTLAQKLTGIPAPRARLPPTLLRRAAGLIDRLETLFALPAAYTAEGLRSSAGVTYTGTNEKARAELGYAPRPLAEKLGETLQAEQARLRGTTKTRQDEQRSG